MTMSLDIVTNDAGELVRREHARELGAGVVISIYRLAKLAQVHELGNQAFMRQLEQTHQIIGDYCLKSGSNVNVLFAHRAVFVAGQLLKANRGVYEACNDLGELFMKLGGSELFIQRDLTREELLAFSEQISNYFRNGAQFTSPTPKIRLREVADAARLRGIELEVLTPDQRIIRAYASAVVIMRRFYEDLAGSRYILPRRIKRIAQSLVDLSDAHASAFLGVTEVRNANFDEAGRAVNTAILAVAIARETTSDRVTLSQIAMAAMMHDVARPRALALASSGAEPGLPGMQGPTMLSEDQEDGLAAGAAAVLTALGRVNEASITRTVVTFESLWLRRQAWLGPVYWGSRPATLHATMIAVARRYNDLLTPEPGLAPKSPDHAVAVLANELRDPVDRTVLRMLVSALGLLPTGTVVQLSTGEVGEVVRGARGLGERPVVRLVADANNVAYAHPVDVDLAQDTRRSVHRVLGVEGWNKGLEAASELEEVPDSAPDRAVVAASARPHANAPAAPSSNAPAQLESQFAGWGSAEPPAPRPERRDSSSVQSGERSSSSSSLPSMGSSPSAVAEAMGRMINDSLRPPAVPPKEPDRRVFQPGAAEGSPAPPRVQFRSTAPEPTARGNLAATPIPHVLVYMLDHALSGSVIFEGTGSNEAMYFVHGVPTKIRLAEPIAPLGQTLVHGGAIEETAVDGAVEGAQRLGILLGEYLVGHDLVSREMVAWGLEAQLLQKVAYVANLAPEVEYSYFRDADMLDVVAADIPVSAPLNPILASVRNWTDRARVRATLNRIGKHPLVIHPDADLTNLAVMPEEQTILDAIAAESMPLAHLFQRGLADEEVVSSLVYSLAVTRQFAFKGQKKGPMAARGSPWRSRTPSSSAVTSAPPETRSDSIASGSRPAPGARPPSAPSLAVNAAPPPSDPRRAAPPSLGGRPPPARPSTSLRAASKVPKIRPIAARTGGSAQTSRAPSPPPTAWSGAPPPHSSAPPDEPETIARAAPLPPVGGSFKIGSVAPAPSTDPPLAGAAENFPIEIEAPNGPMATDPGTEAEAAIEAMQAFRQAEQALARSDVETARTLAERAVEKDPSQPEYSVLVAWIKALDGSPRSIDEAIAMMTSALKDDPTAESPRFYRGKLYARTLRLNEALLDFEEILSMNPNHKEAATEIRVLRTRTK